MKEKKKERSYLKCGNNFRHHSSTKILNRQSPPSWWSSSSSSLLTLCHPPPRFPGDHPVHASARKMFTELKISSLKKHCARLDGRMKIRGQTSWRVSWQQPAYKRRGERGHHTCQAAGALWCYRDHQTDCPQPGQGDRNSWRLCGSIDRLLRLPSTITQARAQTHIHAHLNLTILSSRFSTEYNDIFLYYETEDEEVICLRGSCLLEGIANCINGYILKCTSVEVCLWW